MRNILNRKDEMNIEALQSLAGEIGLHQLGDMPTQKFLIREIQKQRGNEPCYLTDKRYACSENCEWRTSCQKLRAVWLR